MQLNVNGSLMAVNVLFSEKDISTRVKEIAEKINKDYQNTDLLVILIILNGALLFASDLVRNLEVPNEIETLRIKSYEGTASTGHIKLLTPLPSSLQGKHVLIVEDIIDTGRSVDFLIKELTAAKVASYKVCTLLDKPEAHCFPIDADYIGFEIGKNFVIGYGLDLDGRYRHLPYIADLVKAQ